MGRRPRAVGQDEPRGGSHVPDVAMTLAVAHYDRHVPLLDGTVGVDGVDLRVLEIGQSIPGRDGADRHRRMLRDGEFDAAEVSLSSYLLARQRGEPLTAIPIVPRRLFCQSLFFCRRDAALSGPQDLAGKRVGISTYQTTLSVLSKGDLEHEHRVPWKSITWVVRADEIFPFTLPPDVTVERVPAGREMADLLLAGEVDAAILPHPPTDIVANPAVRRVFPDPRRAEADYARKNGYWPIMHLVALRDDVVERHPWAPRAFYDAFRRARDKAAWHWEDPNWSLLPWGRLALEEQCAVLGGDPWRDGLAANRANLERFMTYSTEQGLLERPLPVEQLFHDSVRDT